MLKTKMLELNSRVKKLLLSISILLFEKKVTRVISYDEVG